MSILLHNPFLSLSLLKPGYRAPLMTCIKVKVCVKEENAPNPPSAKQPEKFPSRYITDMADRTCHLT